ncbi:MAG: aminodeoxychorismate/anthranilate synthase component II [Prevotella sp.]|nr:aminodeoxychorismate/anthranilate synthase component II [Prevotella sp.]MDD7273667.1 aminodeoxychorismate/anthranilate synthase component II [Prevotellaceae bacterium]MDY3936382.1 aminodeoxychorismate/anthranilate synthase component II [Prevotella sp.]MDY4218364.1 aminodeoxychorismate/anthranilate synthase component II [Prevotella sp.]
MRCVIIDNYDSFTYNLVHLVEDLGAEVVVFKNDQFALPNLQTFDKILLSPGPGVPSEAGLLLDVIKHYEGKKSILGVCLGHQAIGEWYGGTMENLSSVFHGVSSKIVLHNKSCIFKGLPNMIEVGRYHSWVISTNNLPHELEVTATTKEGLIMGLRHKYYDIEGIQFHPESILTPDGKTIIQNWLNQ